MCKKNSSPPVYIDKPEESQTSLLPVNHTVNDVFGGYYVSLPDHYAETSVTYPVIVFLHGAGQTGNGKEDLKYVINDGIGKLIKDGKFPSSFSSDGKKYSFIVVSPQYSKEPGVNEIVEFMVYVRDNYRVDLHRIYLSGLSQGARLVTLVAARFPSDIAAIVPIAGVALNPGIEDRCKKIAEANLPVWELHNQDDPLANVEDAKNFISLIAGFHPAVMPRITIFDVYGHDAWTMALNPQYGEEGKNIYEWMLQYSR